MGQSIVQIKQMGDALRSSGYKSIDCAVAELIDNSIEAGAHDVFVIMTERVDPITHRKAIYEFGILDNGSGMEISKLASCLGIGFTTKSDRRGMGRFGVGLPQASLHVTPNVEVYSIDEAFVDFTGLTKLYKKNYFKLARELQKRIADEVDIPVTIGISRSKTLAKLASDKAKNTSARIAVIGKCGIHHLLEFTEIQEVWGIGRKLGVRLRGLGVRTALDFINKDDKWVKSKFGKNGLTSKAELSGIMVSPISNEVELPKSISDTKSFLEFSSDLQFLKNELSIHIHESCARLRKIDCKCATIGVLLKTKDFRTLYSKVQLDIPTDFEFEISRAAFPLLTEMFNSREVYRSVGIVLEDFREKAEEQLTLFSNNEKKEQNEKLGQSLDKLEKKFGRNIVRTGFTNKEVPFKQGFLTSPKDV